MLIYDDLFSHFLIHLQILQGMFYPGINYFYNFDNKFGYLSFIE